MLWAGETDSTKRRVDAVDSPADNRQDEQAPVRLTRRELEVLARALTGESNKEVAEALFCSKRTVDYHLNRIYRKLQASNRMQALHRARMLGILPDTLYVH